MPPGRRTARRSSSSGRPRTRRSSSCCRRTAPSGSSRGARRRRAPTCPARTPSRGRPTAHRWRGRSTPATDPATSSRRTTWPPGSVRRSATPLARRTSHRWRGRPTGRPSPSAIGRSTGRRRRTTRSRRRSGASRRAAAPPRGSDHLRTRRGARPPPGRASRILDRPGRLTAPPSCSSGGTGASPGLQRDDDRPRRHPAANARRVHARGVRVVVRLVARRWTARVRRGERASDRDARDGWAAGDQPVRRMLAGDALVVARGTSIVALATPAIGGPAAHLVIVDVASERREDPPVGGGPRRPVAPRRNRRVRDRLTSSW
jgi:hypothetical protein